VEAVRLLGAKLQAGKLGEHFTARGIYRHAWAGLDDRETVKLACERLANMGWLRAVETSGAGRPSAAFEVNPRTRNLDT
jgi:hypothetical protein